MNAPVGVVLLFAMLVSPSVGWACACGCGVFDVGTSSMFPEGPGGMACVEYDFQDQNRNWSGNSKAPAANNDDKEIRTHFVTAGLQYLFNRSWGIQAEVPYVYRTFKTGDGSTHNWGDLGDIRLKGIYTGFSPDLSTGVSFGFKLPTGDYTHDGVDRDTQIGTGSTDLLLGGFHRANFGRNNRWSWFAQAQLDLPMLTRDQYRPGLEFDAAAGIYYNGWTLRRLTITPVAQVIASEKTSDSGANSASPVASGYQRILLSPGIEFHMNPVSVYADVEFPVFENVRGNQLVALALFKVVMSYHF